MNSPGPWRRWGIILAGLTVCVAFASEVNAQWPQWGGPNRNFIVEASGLADSWPEDGPPVLWKRTLGPAYSSIVSDGNLLFTMYRRDKNGELEYTIALDARTGSTVWQSRQRSPIPKGDPSSTLREFVGPNATPLIVGDQACTIGFNGVMRCFKKASGTVVWQHDLPKEFGGEVPLSGFSCSPIAYGDVIIVTAGRSEGQAASPGSLIAFQHTTGEVVWRSQDFSIGHSSPMLISFEGEDQLVAYVMSGLIGVSPRTGALLWRFEHSEEYVDGVVATPVWNGVDTLYWSGRSPRSMGWALKLKREGERTQPERLWSNPKAPLAMATPLLIGDMLVGSKGFCQEPPLLGVNAGTGELLWSQRVFTMANLLYADEKLILLDSNGHLGLATLTADGLTVHSRCQVAAEWSFSPPTLVGTTLYVRDEKHIMALDLSATTGDEKG